MLSYRAGPRALVRLRGGGLAPRDVRALVLPAAGPKWLVASGFDRALIRSGFLEARDEPLLLLGSSAGAWRALALAARDPAATHERLLRAYTRQHFTRSHSAAQIGAAYAALLGEVFDDADLAHALQHPGLSLAMFAVRTRLGTGARVRRVQAAALGAAAAANLLSARGLALFFERVLFEAAPAAQRHALLRGLTVQRAPLGLDNLRQVALASGSVPLYMAPVVDPSGAPPGRYLDGGLGDYHLNVPLTTGGAGVTLLFLHQARLHPSWFDQYAPWRRPSAAAQQDLLLVHPSPEFVARLPGGRIPNRDDFQRLLHAPEQRQADWLRAAALSEELGGQFLDDLQSGRLAKQVAAL
jgi:hypothetical protein